MPRRTKHPIHPSIKTTLGYRADQKDAEVVKDWKARTTRVCKPCWELKYCPYGPLVEQSPLLPIPRADVIAHNEYLSRCLNEGMTGDIEQLSPRRRAEVERLLRDEAALLRRALYAVRDAIRVQMAKDSSDPIAAFMGAPLPPIHEYRVPFDIDIDHKVDISTLPDDMRTKVLAALEADRTQLRTALDTGLLDERKSLDEVRRAYFERTIRESNPGEQPEVIPEIFQEAACNVFGHICPVFFAGEALTETAETRRRGRYIPFQTKIRVVRRDNYTCQHCGRHLHDDEVEFDHKIPIARGGSSEEHNVRLTCFDCNRDKSDRVEI
jgi:hypothetical protein